jgi:hypothetical protein
VGPVEGWLSLEASAMCAVHRDYCRCFEVNEHATGGYYVSFADGSVVGTFCNHEVAEAVATILNYRTSVETLINCVWHVLHRVKLIEDCEVDRLLNEVALRACSGDEEKASELVKEVISDMKKERNYDIAS